MTTETLQSSFSYSLFLFFQSLILSLCPVQGSGSIGLWHFFAFSSLPLAYSAVLIASLSHSVLLCCFKFHISLPNKCSQLNHSKVEIPKPREKQFMQFIFIFKAAWLFWEAWLLHFSSPFIIFYYYLAILKSRPLQPI